MTEVTVTCGHAAKARVNVDPPFSNGPDTSKLKANCNGGKVKERVALGGESRPVLLFVFFDPSRDFASCELSRNLTAHFYLRRVLYQISGGVKN